MCDLFGRKLKKDLVYCRATLAGARDSLVECKNDGVILKGKIRSLQIRLEDAGLTEPPMLMYEVKPAIWMMAKLGELLALPNVGSNLEVLPLVDEEYRILSETSFEAMANWIWTSDKEYVPVFYDCDDFYLHFIALASWYFEINSIGAVVDYSSSHAYNLPILTSGAAIYEPQNRNLITNVVNRNKAHYGLDWGYIQI